MNRTIGIFSVLAVLLPAVAAGGGPATVIGLQGKAWRKDASGELVPISPGERLEGDATVRTGEKGLLKLVCADGSVAVIGANRVLRIGDFAKAEVSPAGAGVFDVLLGLFRSGERVEMGGGRGVAKPTPAGEDQEWRSALVAPRISRSDIPKLLDLVSTFEEPSVRNRAAAILTRLAAEFPEDPGLAQMSRKARAELGAPGQVTIEKRVGGKVSPVQDEDTLRRGDGIRISYTSGTESFLYLYAHSRPIKGAPTTTPLIPDDVSPAKAIPARTPLSLPAPDAFYPLDDVAGREYVLAWVCVAPVGKTEIQQALDGAIGQIGEGRTVSESDLVAHAPAMCPQAYVQAFIHR